MNKSRPDAGLSPLRASTPALAAPVQQHLHQQDAAILSPFRVSTPALAAPEQQHSCQQDAGAPLDARDVLQILEHLSEMFHCSMPYHRKPDWRNDVDQDKVRGIGFRVDRCHRRWVYEVADEKAEDKRHQFAKFMCRLLHEAKPDFKWAAMSIHRRRPYHQAYQHKDDNNSDKHQSCIIGFSEEPDAVCELHLSERGVKLNIKDRFVMFDGKNDKHGPVKHMKGDRYSIVFYTPRTWHEHCDRLDRAVKDRLREELAFQLPLP